MPPPRPPEPPRLIDLRADWLVQYAPETGLFDPQAVEIARRELPRAEGYLGATALSVLMLGPGRSDGDPWKSFGDRLARIEAEFAGRLLIGPEDVARWRDDPRGLTWGVIGVAGLDRLIGSAADLPRLDTLLDRGAHVLQMTAAHEEDRAGTDLERMVFDRLAERAGTAGPILDVAGMGQARLAGVLSRFETDDGLRDRVRLLRSFGPIATEGAGREALARFRTLGGFVALGASSRSFESAEAFHAGAESLASLPFAGREGFEGIGVATDLFGGGSPLRGLETAPAMAAWVIRSFDLDNARALLRGNAEAVLA